MYKNLAAMLVAACCFSPAFAQTASPVVSQTHAAEKVPLKIGFVYVAPLTDAGWVRQHDEGRKAVEAALGDRVKTSFVENVAEGPDAERVIRDLAATGHKLIFTPSFGYMEPTLKVAKDFPDVKFESITGYKTAPNVAAANARYYEGRYLAGIAAGANDANRHGRLRSGLSDSGGAAGHQCLHAGHALGQPQSGGQSGVAQRLV